jgi:methionyl aminopeptidase
MLAKETLDSYQRAGKIAAKVREEIRDSTKEGMPVIQVCEKVERMIRKLGGKPAFPCNVSVNEVTAHYTSPPGDDRKIPEGAVVKIDIGVHVDGYIADTATTVCFDSEYESMVRAAEKALETAVKTIRPGLSTSSLGTEIQKTIETHGFKPISNLTGHQVGRYMVHAGKSLPNVSHFSLSKIRAGDVCAIEPFVTIKSAAGRVDNGPESYIYRFLKRRSLKDAGSRRLLKSIEKRFRTLPFCERWLIEHDTEKQRKDALLDLVASKAVMAYPVFVEASGERVAQGEHTVYVGEDGPIVLT